MQAMVGRSARPLAPAAARAPPDRHQAARCSCRAARDVPPCPHRILLPITSVAPVTLPSHSQRRGLTSWGTCSKGAPSPTRCSRQGAPDATDSSEGMDGPSFRWVTSVSKAAVLALALKQAVQAALAQLPLGSPKPTLAVVFVSSRFMTEYSSVVPSLKMLVPSLEVVLGCSGFGVIGGEIPPQTAEGGWVVGDAPGPPPPEEVEMLSGVSVSLAVLPGVEISTFRITPGRVPDADAPPDRWAELVGAPLPAPRSSRDSRSGSQKDEDRQQQDGEGTDVPHFILLSDPSFAEVHDVLAGLDFAYPTSTKVGGLSSSTSMQEQWCTFCAGGRADMTGEADRGVKYGGMVGVSLWGNGLAIESIVAQGCRPVSDETYTILKGGRNKVIEVEDSKGNTVPPLMALQDVVVRLNPEDQAVVQQSALMVALAHDSLKALGDLEAGDFLIRGIHGADPNDGSLAIGDNVNIGHRMRFMVRDRKGAAEDLEQRLQDYKRRELARTFSAQMGDSGVPFGALLFACNGRGLGLFSEKNFDSNTFSRYVPVGISGYFCNGEIGQVGGTTHLHGFTAVFGVLKQVKRSS